MYDRFNLRGGCDDSSGRTSDRRGRSPFPTCPKGGRSAERCDSDVRRDIQSPRVKPPDTILLPLDVHRCPLEAFSYINQFAEWHTTVILLHVVNLNVVPPDGRVFDELCCAAERDLQRLSQKFLDARLRVRHEVRFGRPADGILEQVRDSNSDLAVMTTHGNSSFWKHPFHPRTVEKVLRLAPCDVMLLHVRTGFNCEDDWLYVNEIASAMEDIGLFKVPTQLLV